jgi:hypothetical protein
MEYLHNLIITKAYASGIIGTINSAVYNPYGSVDNPNGGLSLLLGNVLRIVFMVAGIFALFNFIIGGFEYMGAGGDSKKTHNAWTRIYLSLVGLILIAGSFALAAVLGYLIFGDPLFMLQPKIYGPGA